MEALELIMKKSSTLMIPQTGSSGDITSPANIAQIMATYNHLSKGGSNQMAEQLMQGSQISPETVRNIVEDLERVKMRGSGASGQKDEYRYLDDKTLYSTD